MEKKYSAMNRIPQFFTGFAMVAALMWAQSAMTQETAPVNLESAAGFAVLAGAGITFAAPPESSMVVGDIGTHPTVTITGLDNVVLIGTNHDGDIVTQAAKSDLDTAYGDAAGRSATVSYDPIFDLGGLTLPSGVHSNPSSFWITGELTLDAQGDADAVWIFQTGSTLITAVDSKVVLTNGAQARNVFWQIGSSATLKTGTDFAGSLLVFSDITLDNSATVNGRVLAMNGAVTFASSSVSMPLSSQVITNFIPTNGSVFAETNLVGLSAEASSGLPVSFMVQSGPGTITGGTNLAFTSTGQVSVVASQSGNDSYDPAPDVTNTYTVTSPLPTESGALAIDVTPNGGSWQLTVPADYTGPTAGTGDLAAVSAVTGEYSVTYGALAGYVKPTNQTQFVVANVTSLFEGVYLLIDTNIAPPVVTATEGTYTNKVRISWQSVPDVTGYEIWKSQINDVNTAERLVEVPDYGATTFYYDDYAVVPLRPYFYWGLAKKGTQASPMSIVDMGYASLAPDPEAPTADLIVSDMVFLPVNVTNLTTAGTVSFRLGNLGPSALNSSEVAFDFRIANNTGGMVKLGTDQRAFTLAPGQEELVVLTAQAKRGLVVPPILLGVKQVQVTVRHASTLVDPDLANNTTTAAGRVRVRPTGVNSPGRTGTDCDGDGKADPMVLSADRAWFVHMASGEQYIYQNWEATGVSTPQYLPALGDYDGDGVTDLGLYEETTGIFYVRLSSSGATVSFPAFGGAGYIPVVGDYDGDGKSDPALYNQSTGHWVVRLSLHNYAEAATWLHGPASHYMPVHGDYDGDGLTDPAAYSTTSGMLVVGLSSQNYREVSLLLGGMGCVGIRGDFDGDGLADPAIYHEATGTWDVYLSGAGYNAVSLNMGGPGWLPVPADYDGDGKTDPAVYYSPLDGDEGIWQGLLSSQNYILVEGRFGGLQYDQICE